MTPLANPAKMIEEGAPRIIQTEEELGQYADALFRLTAEANLTVSELQAIGLASGLGLG